MVSRRLFSRLRYFGGTGSRTQQQDALERLRLVGRGQGFVKDRGAKEEAGCWGGIRQIARCSAGQCNQAGKRPAGGQVGTY